MLKLAPDPFQDPTILLSNPKTNPYVEKIRQASGKKIFYGKDLDGKAGRWREVMGLAPSTPLILEIGCHKGKTLLAMANDHPDLGFIGMDITYKRVFLTAQRAEEQNITNIAALLCNANFIHRVFDESEIDGVVIFFPDPWPKLKHSKHRLVQADFCQRLSSILKPQGFVWLKTDSALYFKASIELLENAGLGRSDALPYITTDYKTCFQEKFEKRGIPAHAMKFTKHKPLAYDSR